MTITIQSIAKDLEQKAHTEEQNRTLAILLASLEQTARTARTRYFVPVQGGAR